VEPQAQLPKGIYRLRCSGTNDVMVVTSGGAPGGVIRHDLRREAACPLETVRQWFNYLWAQAAPIPEPKFDVTDDVQYGGEAASVRSRRYSDRGWIYRIKLGGTTSSVHESSLRPPDGPGEPSDWIQGSPAGVREIAATLTRAKLKERLTDTIYSLNASRTIFRPYQFKPVIKLLQTGSKRLLIADEVGLGKTIEAGLVLSEFDARGLANRVLVVCPSTLVGKWRWEMSERFSFGLKELDSRG